MPIEFRMGLSEAQFGHPVVNEMGCILGDRYSEVCLALGNSTWRQSGRLQTLYTQPSGIIIGLEQIIPWRGLA
jgi:hypothetical protein